MRATGRQPHVPSGMFEVTVTDEVLRSRGFGPETYPFNVDVFTWAIADGQWSSHQEVNE